MRLITLDKDGAPRARTMDPFPVEDDFTVWFGTNSNSRKVVQIKNDPRVTPLWLEILSPTHEIYNDPTTWQPPIILFDQE